ncbi:protein-glutamate O-methyltransferase CheR [Roseisolibacter sp. H3M3-2]|uniref:CheR family methyltransferase n=1 Tax=Roseisolibacter sp. H3M3-2 TaxID=3031323 RepID=UPI0023D98AF1|nr:protein-glutamate O-methyltransferase CheR [Roseisolibacter sp. H3M3-2]MDF1504328.1 protein-glutamate O-methyltransferase CheR [Roseisolibacter sp. H3M3-2]
MSTLVADSDLSAAHFREISRTVYDIAGIQLREGKEGLVRARLAKRLRQLAIPTFDAYLDQVRADPRELAEMIDLLTTNKTSFFRESAHFDYLRDQLLPSLGAGPVRIWSAGCSSGEEPYTLAMVLRETWGADLGRRDVKVLATDISRRVLATAAAGVYPDALLEDVPAELRRRYWTRAETPGARGAAPGWRAADALRALVTFAPLNLMGAWPMRGPFQAIFCRNVMIYFDKATQQQLVSRYYDLLAPGGHLFVGHSESLSALSHRFAYVQPAVYRR